VAEQMTANATGAISCYLLLDERLGFFNFIIAAIFTSYEKLRDVLCGDHQKQRSPSSDPPGSKLADLPLYCWTPDQHP
jgi:hypothetical protein